MKKILLLLTIFLVASMTAYAVGTGSGGSNPEAESEAKPAAESEAVVEVAEPALEVEPVLETEPAFAEPAAVSVVAVDYTAEVCHDLETLEERIECRLIKGADALKDEPFMPEECRAIDDDKEQVGCVEKYEDLYPCWDKPGGQERISCVKEILGLPQEIQHVDEMCGAGMEYCRGNYIEAVYSLIKYRFYDGEERVEDWYEAGRLELADTVEFIAMAVNSKIAFNEAGNRDEREEVINAMIEAWDDVVLKVQK